MRTRRRVCVEHRLAEPLPVRREVVAADQGQRPGISARPGAQPGDQQAGYGRRRGAAGQLRPQTVVHQKASRRGVQEVSLFGNGQRDDPDRRIGDEVDHAGGIGRQVANADDRAHDPGARSIAVQAGDAEQPVLRRKPVGHGTPPGCHTDDAPVATASQGAFGVHRLVSAVEGADAEVDDAGPDVPRPYKRAGAVRYPAEGGAAQPCRHTGPSGNEYSAIDSGRIVTL